MEALTYEDFKALACARKRAFHLKLRDTYNVESEDEPFRRWPESVNLNEAPSRECY
jgi:hypothetical protein